jgi:hypothetical protein
MAEIVSGSGYATFINTFRCKPSNRLSSRRSLAASPA